MTQKTDSFERFWKELKRRKVVYVITVYAAIAFVILQLVDIVAEPLRLPVSTKALVIVLLCIGFVIAIFLSWVYDVTPSGIKKTKPVSSVKNVDNITSPSSSGWKIATYVSGILIIALIAFNIISKRSHSSDTSSLEKSIAVLPFRNDSPNDTNAYFINGIMEKVLNNLQVVKELRVISRTSVEQYRNTTKSIPEIAKETGVNYIVEGSGQKYGETFSVSVQLIKAAKENHLWGKSYEQEIREIRDIIRVQSEIAQSIASELKTTITPEEKQLIEKIPTTDIAAYDFYLKGVSYLRKENNNDLKTAMLYFELAIDKDPKFALAYVGISSTWYQHIQLGDVEPRNGAPKALEAVRRAIELDSISAEARRQLAVLKLFEMWDWKGAEADYKKIIAQNPNYADAYRAYAYVLVITGRTKEAMEQIDQALKLDPINPGIKFSYANDLIFVHKYEKAISVLNDILRINPSDWYAIGNIPVAYHLLGKYKEGFESWKLYYNTVYKDFVHVFDQGYAKGGYSGALNLEADTLVAQSKTAYFLPTEIAILYASAGNKKRALDMLERAYEVRDPNLVALRYPIYDCLRNEPRYQDLCRKMNLPYE